MGLGGQEAASKLRGHGAQFALLCFYGHNFTPPITTHHLAKLSLLLFKKKKSIAHFRKLSVRNA